MIVSSSFTKEKSAMRKPTSYATIVAAALLFLSLSIGSSLAQGGLFNYTPYPFISIDQEDYYPDGNYVVPDALPGGERYFLVPVFIYNGADPLKNPNTKDGTFKTDAQRIGGVDGQNLVPIRSFSFQLHYPNQAVRIDDNPAHGSPIVMVGPDKNNALAATLATPFYTRWTEQSANDSTNPFHRLIRVSGASEVPLPLTSIGAGPGQYTDSSAILLYIRFKIIPNWTVNTAVMRLDTAVFADHVGDQQYDPANYLRGNLAGHRLQQRGQMPVYISAQPAFELRPFSAITTTDNKNYNLTPTLVYDPTGVNPQNPSVNLQIRDAVGSTRLTNINICSDQDWLKVGLTAGSTLHCVYIPRIDYTGSISSEEKQLFITGDPSGLAPGVYIGYVTLTSDGASNSPSRIKVTFVVRARPDEPNESGGTGIRLNLTNSCSPSCTRQLVFGTGTGATDGIDLLYGESIFTVGDRATANSNPDPTQKCYAYFETLNPNADPAFQDPNFLGTSRDIRSNTNEGTILYKVTFGTGGALCYPLNVCFDPTDLPEGSRFIIRDILNGGNFSFNMREATGVGNQRCIVIRDPSITSFIIEYTPGTKGHTADLKKQAWNFISLPVIAPDQRATIIFPNSTGTPFSYASNAGWTPATTLDFGRGYMIHYGTVIGNDNLVAGVGTTKLSGLRVHAGWNSVGGVSVPACVTDNDQYIFFTPVGGSSPSRQTDFFEYVPGNGYRTVAYLIPGHGYFVKVSDEANYNIDAKTDARGCKVTADATSQLKAELSKVTVRDAAQNGQELFFGNVATNITANHFEMPPAMISFDARFTANNGNISAKSDEHVVKIASADYPVSLSFADVNGSVEVRDLTGNVIGSVVGNGTVVIRDASVKQVVIALKGASDVVNGFALESSYPNPTNALSNFNFAVPSETNVKITLTNALGQEVSTLVNGVMSAGRHEVKIDGSKLSEGTYFYTIHAGNFVKTEKLTIVH